MPKSYTQQVIDNLLGFDAWAKRWGDWHMKRGGKPGCPHCKGTGKMYINKDAERCLCMK